MPTSSAIVICTESTKLPFHTGSNSWFAKRKASRFWTVSLPR